MDTGILPNPPQFLSLPVEIRFLIYQYSLSESDGTVIVVSNYSDGQPPARIRFFTITDLSLLEACKYIRAEASDVFYREPVFTLKSYPRKLENFGQQPLYGEPCFQIEMRRIRKFHILTPPGFFPRSYGDCILGGARMQAFLKGLAETLTTARHSMRYLLIESYEFEWAVIGENSFMRCGLPEILRPLERIRGLQICHIRSLEPSHQRYLRHLEDCVTQYAGESRVGRVSTSRTTSADTDPTKALGESHGPSPDELFGIMGIEPLYLAREDIDAYYQDDF